MSEADWWTQADPEVMCLRLGASASARQLRLFAAACCRRVWELLSDGPGRDAVAVAERVADGQDDPGERAAAEAAAHDRVRVATAPRGTWPAALEKAANGVAASAAQAALAVLGPWPAAPPDAPPLPPGELAPVRDPFTPARYAAEVARLTAQAAARAAGDAAAARGDPSWETVQQAAHARERLAQAALLRDVCGGQLWRGVVDPSWLRWHEGTAVRLARAVYEARRFGDLPVLADALEEAGCTDAALLDHCRQPGEHARGCWVVDLLLGKG